METVSSQLQDMYKESVSQANSGKKSISSLDIRLTRLEEHMHKIVDVLHELAAPEPKSTPSDVESARSGRTVSLSDVELRGKISTFHVPMHISCRCCSENLMKRIENL